MNAMTRMMSTDAAAPMERLSAAALRLEATVEALMRTIHAHPTMAEAIGEAAHAVHGAAIHL